jgi:hypothetical protein
MAVVVSPPITVIPFAKSVKLATDIKKRLKVARVIQDPKELIRKAPIIS